MLTINMISGILNLISNGGLGTQSGTQMGAPTPSHALGSGGDLGATQIVSGSSAAQSTTDSGGATSSGASFEGAPHSAKHSAPHLPAQAQIAEPPANPPSDQNINDINSPMGKIVESSLGGTGIDRTGVSDLAKPERAGDSAPLPAQASEGLDEARIAERLLTAMATKAFAQAATISSAPEAEAPAAAAVTVAATLDAGDLGAAPPQDAAPAPQTLRASGSTAIAVQERLIRAELLAQLTQLAKTQDVGPSDALRMMAGHNPQFPLEDPSL